MNNDKFIDNVHLNDQEIIVWNDYQRYTEALLGVSSLAALASLSISGWLLPIALSGTIAGTGMIAFDYLTDQERIEILDIAIQYELGKKFIDESIVVSVKEKGVFVGTTVNNPSSSDCFKYLKEVCLNEAATRSRYCEKLKEDEHMDDYRGCMIQPYNVEIVCGRTNCMGSMDLIPHSVHVDEFN